MGTLTGAESSPIPCLPCSPLPPFPPRTLQECPSPNLTPQSCWTPRCQPSHLHQPPPRAPSRDPCLPPATSLPMLLLPSCPSLPAASKPKCATMLMHHAARHSCACWAMAMVKAAAPDSTHYAHPPGCYPILRRAHAEAVPLRRNCIPTPRRARARMSLQRAESRGRERGRVCALKGW